MMRYWGFGPRFHWGMGGFGLLGGLLGLLFTLVVVVAIILLIVALIRRAGRTRASDRAGELSAREILERRYARGELNREQFQQMLEDLGGPKQTG